MACLLSLCSCSSEFEEMESNVVSKEQTSSNIYRVSESSAVNEVQNLLNSMDTQLTRADKPSRTVKSVQFIDGASASTRSTNTNFEGIYVVNFENNEGFALASADNRTTPVFCIVDEGEFSLGEDINPGLAAFLDNLDAAINDTTSGIYLSACSEEADLETRSEPVYGDWQILTNIAPKIQVHWNQTYPYNMYYPMVGEIGMPDYRHILTGSSVVAIGMILSALQPQPLGPLYYNWSSIISPQGSAEGVASLFKEIGEALFEELEYTQETCDIDDAQDYFEDWDLEVEKESDADDHVDDAIAFLSETISHDNLIYSRADSEKKAFLGIPLQYSGDYAWAIDGCVVRQRTVTKTNIFGKPKTSTETQRLLHCNMGYGGTCDGYYIDTEFNIKVSNIYADAYMDTCHNLVYRNKFLYISK